MAKSPGIKLKVNGTACTITWHPPGAPLLWALRDELNLLGTKFGCGAAYCGACTVHIDGVPVRAFSTTLAEAAGRDVVTIEGLAAKGGTLHPLQQAWIDHDVPQCGYCQAGQIMSAAALLDATPKPTDSQIDDAMQGNLCRCGTYWRVREAIHAAAEAMARGPLGKG